MTPDLPLSVALPEVRTCDLPRWVVLLGMMHADGCCAEDWLAPARVRRFRPRVTAKSEGSIMRRGTDHSVRLVPSDIALFIALDGGGVSARSPF